MKNIKTNKQTRQRPGKNGGFFFVFNIVDNGGERKKKPHIGSLFAMSNMIVIYSDT